MRPQESVSGLARNCNEGVTLYNPELHNRMQFIVKIRIL